jgi:peptide/nickel transport system substrate-binding protein
VKPSLTPRARIPRRAVTALTATMAAAVLLVTAACQTADAGDEVDLPQRGGTLQVSMIGWPRMLDPQLIGAAVEANFSKLVTRTLTTFRAEAERASEIVPDLATDTGRPNADNTVWDFTIRENVRWEDGEPVTCRDLKYGVERRFTTDPQRQSGSTVPRRYLQDNDPPYEGPWVGNNNDGEGLESVECIDQRQIRYHLNRPVGDFNMMVASPVFAPVRPGADDDRDQYRIQPLATGPYLVAEHHINPEDSSQNRLVLERNPHWDPATDGVRPAYPDRIVLTQTADIAVLTNDLVNDEGDDRNRIMLDWNIAETFLQQVMTDPELSRRVAAGPEGSVRYLPVNTELIPDVECRQALAYAVNKRKLRSVFGGQLLGDLATGMIPPNMEAHLEFDIYGTREHPDGQPERAREILDQAAAEGIECPTEIRFAHPDNPTFRRLANTVVESYQRIGIQVELVPVPLADYFTADGIMGEEAYEHVWIGLVPGWPNGSAIIPSLFDGRNMAPGSASYLIRLNDERINDLIDQAMAEGDLERQYLLWGELDRELIEMAAVIPLMWNDALRMHGSNVRGAFIHPQMAMPDLSAIGLADPSLAGPDANEPADGSEEGGDGSDETGEADDTDEADDD